MESYVGLEDIAEVLRAEQREYFDSVFMTIDRKLSWQEFTLVLRAMNQGVAPLHIAASLDPPLPQLH